MTLPAYPGRHAFFDGTTVLPAAPPAGAPPGRRPGTVEAAFWTMVLPAALGVLTALVAAGVSLVFGVGYGAWQLYVLAAVLLVGGVGGNVAWFVLGWRTRNGSPGARVGYAVMTGVGVLTSAVLAVPLWATLLPLVALGCQIAVLVLLFQPASNAWFRR
jgi:hypothetical protein